MTSGTKALTGHLGRAAGRRQRPRRRARRGARGWRIRTGAILGPFEAWLAHRSLATLGLRLERASPTRSRWRRLSPAATTSRTCAGRASARCCRSRCRPRRPPRLSSTTATWSARRQASAASTRPPAPRALGHRRRPRGIHPLLGRLRGHRGPRAKTSCGRSTRAVDVQEGEARLTAIRAALTAGRTPRGATPGGPRRPQKARRPASQAGLRSL